MVKATDRIKRSSVFKRRLALIVASMLVGGLTAAAVALADQLNADLNAAVNGDQTSINLGTLPASSSQSQNVTLWVRDTGSGGPQPTYPLNVSGSGNLGATFTGVTLPGSAANSSDANARTGQVQWTTPAAQATAQNYTITVNFSAPGFPVSPPAATVTINFSVAAAPANTAPTTPGKPALAAGSATPNQGVFDLTWAASTDPESNPITYRLEHRDANDAAYSLVPGAGTLGSNSFSFTAAAKESEGTWTYQVRASDGTLNSGFSPASDPIKVDRSSPSAPTANNDRSPEDSGGNWFWDTVTVSYSGSTDPSLADGSAGSGVASYSANQTFNTSGIHNYSGKATDNAGNESSATTGQVKVDATDPQVQITSGCPTGLVARNSTQNINVAASDAHSGLATDPSGSVALDTSTPGEHTKTVTAVDKVGRSKSASCTYTVNSPPTKPGTPQASSSPNKGAFTVSWDPSSDPDGNLDHYLLQHRDADDAGYSTVANVAATATPSYEFTTGSPEDEGTWNYRVIAVDELDESGPESDESGSVKVDRTAPSAPSATTTPSSPYFAPWFKNSVTVGYSGPDVPSVPNDPNLPDGSAGSGVASYTPSQTFSTSGTHNYSGTATDAAGNESAPKTGQVKVDATDPTVSISGCPTGDVPLGSSQSVTVSAGDAHSGLKSDPSGPVSLDTSSIGQKTKTVTATDNVDRSASVSCTYTVIWDWSGFFRPVDNKDADGDYILNQAKAGSAVPVKFSLDGPPVPGSNTGQGPSVFAAGYPASNAITCGSSDEVDAIEETATAGSSTLTYDPVADQYVYVWKTLKEWGGKGCRQLVVELADGTVHRANFKFTK